MIIQYKSYDNSHETYPTHDDSHKTYPTHMIILTKPIQLKCLENFINSNFIGWFTIQSPDKHNFSVLKVTGVSVKVVLC